MQIKEIVITEISKFANETELLGYYGFFKYDNI